MYKGREPSLKDASNQLKLNTLTQQTTDTDFCFQSPTSSALRLSEIPPPQVLIQFRQKFLCSTMMFDDHAVPRTENTRC